LPLYDYIALSPIIAIALFTWFAQI